MHLSKGSLRVVVLLAAPMMLSATLTGDPKKDPETRSTLQFIAIGGIACIALDRLLNLRKKP